MFWALSFQFFWNLPGTIYEMSNITFRYFSVSQAALRFGQSFLRTPLLTALSFQLNGLILTYKPLEVRRNVAIRSYICARKNDLIWKKNTWEGNFISEIWVFLAEKCRTEQWFTTNVLMNFLNFLLNSSLTLFLIYLFVVLKFLVKFLPLEIVVKVRSMKFLLLNKHLSLPFWFLCTISSCQLASIKVSTIKVHFLYVIAAAWYSVTYFLLKVPKKPFVFVNPTMSVNISWMKQSIA